MSVLTDSAERARQTFKRSGALYAVTASDLGPFVAGYDRRSDAFFFVDGRASCSVTVGGQWIGTASTNPSPVLGEIDASRIALSCGDRTTYESGYGIHAILDDSGKSVMVVTIEPALPLEPDRDLADRQERDDAGQP